jgi:hypothetical protein
MAVEELELEPPKRLVLAPELAIGSVYDPGDDGCGARWRRGLKRLLVEGGE